MQFGPAPESTIQFDDRRSAPRRSRGWPASFLCLLAAATLLTGGAQQTSPPDAAVPASADSQNSSQQPNATGAVNTGPDQQASKDGARVGTAGKRQIAVDSARLLTLAVALKAEVDKTDKDTLSMSVIRKASEIEKFAHSVKENGRVTAGIEPGGNR